MVALCPQSRALPQPGPFLPLGRRAGLLSSASPRSEHRPRGGDVEEAAGKDPSPCFNHGLWELGHRP